MKDFNIANYIRKNNSLLKETIEEAPVKPSKIYTNDWMEDVDGKVLGKWQAFWEHPGVIAWYNIATGGNAMPEVVVYATPGWDGSDATPLEVHTINSDFVYSTEFGEASYPDFESYAIAIKPQLEDIENKYESGEFADEIGDPKFNDLEETVKEDDTMSADDRIGGLINQNILKSFLDAADGLMNDLDAEGFEEDEIIQFLVKKLQAHRKDDASRYDFE